MNERIWKRNREIWRESYDLNLPYGIATLDKWHGDRGDWRLTFNLQGPVKNIMRFVSNMYFFELEVGMTETEAWIELGESQPSFGRKQSTLPIDLAAINWELVRFSAAKLIPGKLCIASIVEFVDPFKVWMASPAVPAGVETFLHVDVDDRFPRWYLNGKVAEQETIAWLRRRNQLVTENFTETAVASIDGIWKFI